jgi:hypothetical protein
MSAVKHSLKAGHFIIRTEDRYKAGGIMRLIESLIKPEGKRLEVSIDTDSGFLDICFLQSPEPVKPLLPERLRQTARDQDIFFRFGQDPVYQHFGKVSGKFRVNTYWAAAESTGCKAAAMCDIKEYLGMIRDIWLAKLICIDLFFDIFMANRDTI